MVRNLFRTVIAATLAIAVTFGTFVPAFESLTAEGYAYTQKVKFESDWRKDAEQYLKDNPAVKERFDEELVKAQSDFSQMSIEEINRAIDDLLNNTQDCRSGLLSEADVTTKAAGIIITYYEMKLAWLLAAQVARVAGYHYAATIVEHSVWGNDYNENATTQNNNAGFSTEIRKTRAYNEYLTDIINNVSRRDFEIKKSDHSDLFFALRKVECNARKLQNGKVYIMTVHDDFDFALENYDDLFTDLVNNWALLCQWAFILHPISIDIVFKEVVGIRGK